MTGNVAPGTPLKGGPKSRTTEGDECEYGNLDHKIRTSTFLTVSQYLGEPSAESFNVALGSCGGAQLGPLGQPPTPRGVRITSPRARRYGNWCKVVHRAASGFIDEVGLEAPFSSPTVFVVARMMNGTSFPGFKHRAKLL